MTKAPIAVALPYELWAILRARAEEQNQTIEEYATNLLEALIKEIPEEGS